MTGKSGALLSLIDVISCGLGAAVLLFLIYSALPHHETEDPSGQRQQQGSSAAPRRATGAVTPRAGKGNTVGLRVVEVRGVDPAQVVQGSWAPLSSTKDCEQFRMVTRGAVAFVLSCPTGFDPGVRLSFESPSVVAGTARVRALAADGNEVQPSGADFSACGGGLSVVFQLKKKAAPMLLCGVAP